MTRILAAQPSSQVASRAVLQELLWPRLLGQCWRSSCLTRRSVALHLSRTRKLAHLRRGSFDLAEDPWSTRTKKVLVAANQGSVPDMNGFPLSASAIVRDKT